jgi:hypothetical protein
MTRPAGHVLTPGAPTGSEAPAPLPLSAASRRLRRPAGRPRRQVSRGAAIQGAALEPAPGASANGHFAAALPRRGLAAPAAAAFLGVSLRQLWRLVGRGLVRPVRWPGCRRVVFDSVDLEGLFGDGYKG